MKKRILAAVLATASILGAVSGCNDTPAVSSGSGEETSKAEGSGDATSDSEESKDKVNPADEGKVLNIWAWNEEFKGFFEKYYTVPEGVTVNWVINPSDGGVYQQKLDEAILAQADAAADEKIDMFLAEADYIKKYTNTEATLDVSTIGVEKLDTQYEYTVQAASDDAGKVKGVSFQCCPSALIYRKSIAKDVLGVDDPASVQEALSDWTKFEEVAAKAKEKGYLMTGSNVATFRVFSNNVTSAWVEDGKLNIDPAIDQWTEQSKKFYDNGYTTLAGIWEDGNTKEMFKDGKAMCYFGPSWYYNFSMTNAQDREKGSAGDWAITTGPQAHFWGGTWLLAATGTDNPTLVADIMNAFIADEEVLTKLVEKEGQFVNNSAINQKYAEDPNYGNKTILDGQNDFALYVDLAKNIKFEHKTGYDQLLSEKYPEYMKTYFDGSKSKDEALADFKQYVKDTYPEIVVE